MSAESAAVKALGEEIGFGRVIQLAHQHWDAMLEAKHGIKGHSESWTLASADLIRERRAAVASERSEESSPRQVEGEGSREEQEPPLPPSTTSNTEPSGAGGGG